MPKISTSSIIRENIRHGFLDPRKLFDGAKSIISLTYNYFTDKEQKDKSAPKNVNEKAELLIDEPSEDYAPKPPPPTIFEAPSQTSTSNLMCRSLQMVPYTTTIFVNILLHEE